MGPAGKARRLSGTSRCWGLALAVLVVIFALVLLVVSLVGRDERVVGRSAVALLVGILTTGACYAGAIVVIGDAPFFCF